MPAAIQDRSLRATRLLRRVRGQRMGHNRGLVHRTISLKIRPALPQSIRPASLLGPSLYWQLCLAGPVGRFARRTLVLFGSKSAAEGRNYENHFSQFAVRLPAEVGQTAATFVPRNCCGETHICRQAISLTMPARQGPEPEAGYTSDTGGCVLCICYPFFFLGSG